MAAVEPLLHELDVVDAPIEAARGLPNHLYTTEASFELERDRVFNPTWVCVGAAHDVPDPGSVAPVDLMGQPLVMVRGADRALRVFHNVCSHRGNVLVREPGRARGSLRCPYHSWNYDLDGSLRGTPHIGGPGVHAAPGFDPSCHGLKPVRTGEWLGMVFVNVSGDGPTLEDHVGPLARRIEALTGRGAEALLHPAPAADEVRLELAANWKLLVENFLESYHLPWIHPELNSYSRMEDHYQFVEVGRHAGQGTTVYDPVYREGEALPGFPEWPGDRLSFAEYPALYPNVFVGVHVDQLWVTLLLPVSASDTRERMVQFYLGEAADGERHAATRASTHAAWRKIFVEDIDMVEGMQRGRSSPGFAGGVFSAHHEKTSHDFVRWVASRLRARPAAGPA